MIEIIKKNRMVLVQEYLKPYLKLYDTLARGRCTVDLGRREHLTSIEEHSACDAMAFGSLFKAFQSLGHNITLPGIVQRKAKEEVFWGQARRMEQPAAPWGQGQHANSSWW
ncbi:hypothetical protein CFRS1_v015483 [Colletotrichum fructicola]|nr:hypothetical protein CFRS1_v015483 [Colletotrichum fructicola]